MKNLKIILIFFLAIFLLFGCSKSKKSSSASKKDKKPKTAVAEVEPKKIDAADKYLNIHIKYLDEKDSLCAFYKIFMDSLSIKIDSLNYTLASNADTAGTAKNLATYFLAQRDSIKKIYDFTYGISKNQASFIASNEFRETYNYKRNPEKSEKIYNLKKEISNTAKQYSENERSFNEQITNAKQSLLNSSLHRNKEEENDLDSLVNKKKEIIKKLTDLKNTPATPTAIK